MVLGISDARVVLEFTPPVEVVPATVVVAVVVVTIQSKVLCMERVL